MKSYTKTYFKFFDYDESSYIPCELCGNRAVDIHHIFGRTGDLLCDINNLIALCRECHNLAHAEKITEEQLKQKHETIIRD